MNAEEKTLCKASTSRRAFSFAYLLIILFTLLGIYSFTQKNQVMSVFGLVFLVVSLSMLVSFEIKVRQKWAVITDKRIIVHKGIMRRSVTTIKYPSINEIALDQNLFSRMFGYGTLTIRTSGAQHHDITLENMGAPSRVKNLVEQKMMESEQKQK